MYTFKYNYMYIYTIVYIYILYKYYINPIIPPFRHLLDIPVFTTVTRGWSAKNLHASSRVSARSTFRDSMAPKINMLSELL